MTPSKNEQTFSQRCWPEPGAYFTVIVLYTSRQSQILLTGVCPLVTEFYSGQDRQQQQTRTVGNPRLAQSQLWPTMSFYWKLPINRSYIMWRLHMLTSFPVTALMVDVRYERLMKDSSLLGLKRPQEHFIVWILIWTVSVNFMKVGSIYWGKFAQGPIQILPIWDTTWTLLSYLFFFFFVCDFDLARVRKICWAPGEGSEISRWVTLVVFI